MSDLIKREDAIKALSKVFTECEPCDKEEAVDIAITTVKEIPSADTDLSEYSDKLWRNAYERGKADGAQGTWIDIEPRLNRRRVNKYKRCSHCGFSWARPFDDNYCPNCGAYMKGADDD